MASWHFKSLTLSLLTLFLFPVTGLAQTPQGSIGGQVLDARSQEPLVGVNVQLEGTTLGTATNLDGNYLIEQVPAGTQRLLFSYIGFTSFVQTDVIVRPGRTTEVNVDLQEAVLETEGVTVSAGYFQTKDTEITSVVSFSTEEIRRSPGAGQEIARVLNAIPGVAARGETSQDLFVRGGSPSENAFYIDNIFIPNAQHFSTGDGSSFGPTGLINTEFIERIDFYTGGFSAAYGDRLSSVSNLTYRDGNPFLFTGELGLNFSGGSAILEAPLPNGKGSWFVSGRRSYLDLIANAIDAGGAPRFADLQGKVTYKLDKRNTISMLNLYGSSRFKQVRDDAVEDGDDEFIDAQNEQNTIGTNWRHLWKGDGFSNTSISYSFRDRNFTSTDVLSDARKIEESLLNQSIHFRNVSFFNWSDQTQLEFGADFSYEQGTFDYEQDTFVSRSGLQHPGFDRDLSLDILKASAFVSAIVRPVVRLQAVVGTRVDYASLNEQIYVSPRLALSYQLTSRLALNGSVGVFRQAIPLFLASQADANEDLEHLTATHYIAGISYLFTPSTQLTFEVYHKDYSNAPELTRDNPLGDPAYVLDSRGNYAGNLVSTGSGYASGVDVMLQKKLAEKVYGLVSASFFRSRYRDYQGTWRSRLFDNKVIFNVIGGYKPNDAWEVSVRWTYSGGRPYTPIDATQTQAFGDEVLDLTRFNDERLPAYHSLFIRADRRFNFRQTNLVTYVSLWNAYNRANVDEFYWNFTDEQVDERTQFALLPIVGMEFEF